MNKILYTLIWISVLCNTSVYSADLSSLDNPKISLFCQNTPLKEVVDDVYRQTGFTIHVEDTLLAMPITGKFSEMEIVSFFRRIFRGENISLLIFEKNKSCIVRTFGEKERKYYSVGTNDPTDPLTGMKSSELAALNGVQRKAFQEYSQDPESIDLLTGKKLDKIRESQERQRELFLKYSQNADSIDPIVGKTLVEVEKSHDQQRQAFQAYSGNTESVDPMTGQKLVEVKKSNDLQLKEFKIYSNNPESVDPLTGLTLGQIRESQEKQRNEFLGN